jgi:predicted nuclease of predicted toxin-antitoxin system
MRIKLDENLPAELVRVLAEFGHEADSSVDEGFTGRPDEEVWDAAKASGRLLFTQDMDFSDVRKFAPGSHQGLVLVRMDHPSRRILCQRMRQVLQTEDIESWKGCFVVVSERKIRVRRP